ncbi:MAG: acyltransferase family protein [Acidimicrobiales bacterium]
MGEPVVRTDGAPHPPPTASSPRLPYVGAIDGVRAIAIVAVLLYHGDVPWIPGGFLGVEVFFVVSGYLITALLLREHTETGTIRIGRFIGRRARRLLPALGIYLVGSYLIALVLARDVLDSFREGIWAAVFYVYNWFAIGNDISYAEGFGRKSFLHHLWSLAIEEQFYLLWPLILLAGMAVIGRRWMFIVTLGLIAASTALMWLLYEPFTDPVRVYYGTDTRAAGLLVGAATAFFWRPWEWRELSRFWRGLVGSVAAVVGIGSLVFLGWSMHGYDLALPLAQPLFQGGFLLVSVATAVLIAAVAAPANPLARLMALAPLKWLGTRSYGLYLWHWPIYQVTRPRIDIDLDVWSALAFRFALTAMLAEASYRLIEEPIRRGRFLHGPSGATWQPPAVVRAVVLGPAVVFAAVVLVMGAQTDQHDGSDAGEEVAAAAEATSSDQVSGPQRQPEATEVEPEAPVPAATPVEPDRGTADPTVSPLDAFPEQPSGPNETGPPVDPAQVAAPTPTPPVEEVTFIGDSVMEGAAPALLAMLPDAEIHTEVGRHWFEASELVDELETDGDLGDAVVIHLGNNSPISEDLFDEVMTELADVELVAVVNVRVPVRWEGTVNEELAAGVGRWDNAVLVDWHDRSNNRPKFFANDGVHIGERGRKAYARIIAQALGLDPAVVQTEAAPTATEPDEGDVGDGGS